MSRRSTPRVAAVVAVLALAAGCSSEPIDDATSAPSTAAESPTDDVVGEVTSSVDGASSLLAGHYLPTIDELLASTVVENIVVGRIESLRYEFIDELMAYTAMTISVESQTAGSEQSVVVWESGGLIPVSELPRDELELLGLTGTEDGVVDYATEGGEHPEVGDQVLLFLYDTDGTGVFADSFGLVGGAQGRFVQDSSTGDYVRAATEEGYDTVITAEQVREVVPEA